MQDVDPAAGQDVEGHREGLQVEHLRAPSAKLLWKDKATEAATEVVLDFLRSTRVGCLVTLRRPPEEEEGEESEGENGGPAPLKNVLFFVSTALGRRKGSPTRTAMPIRDGTMVM